LGNGVPTQQCHDEDFPYPCRNLVLRPTTKLTITSSGSMISKHYSVIPCP
jgi:hypothetical protein